MPDGLVIPGGPGFSGHPQPPDVPCDPTGDAWRGEPGPPGPPGVPGPPGGLGEAPVDGFAYGRVNAVWQNVLPLTGGTLTGPLTATTVDAVTLQNFAHRVQTGGTFNTALGIYGVLSGTKTAGNSCFARINLQSDTLNAGAGGITTMLIDQTSGGAGTVGNRIGQYINFNFTGGPTNKSLSMGNQYGALWAYANISGNVGGTALTPGNTWGTVWGGVSSASLKSGATFWTTAIGHEVNVGVAAGASAAIVEGCKIVIVDHDQGPGTVDYLLGFSAGANRCTQWSPKGISFGSSDGVWPFDPAATLIGTIASNASLPGIRTYTAATGIDLSAVTFSSAAFKSTGFQVDGAGHCSPLLANAANDAAAATAGVPIGAMYRTGNAVQVRLV